MRRWQQGLLLLVALLLLACSSPSTSGKTAGGNGELLLTRGQSLYTRDMGSGKDTRLFDSPPGVFIEYPTWSPDGARFAYILDTPFQGNVGADWGGDIWLADANGSNAKEVLQHDHPGVEVASLSWTTDGSALLFGYSYTQYDSAGKYVGQTLEARRFTLASGAVTTVVPNATYPSLCADGSKLTWVNFPPDGSSPEAVMIGAADGSDAHAAVTADVSGSGNALQDFSYPRFTPDCTGVIFGAVGGLPNSRNLAGSNPMARFFEPFVPRAAEAHGPPWDLWSAANDGSGLKRLTHVNEDLPFPAFSKDGQTVVFIGTYGIYQMTAAGGGLKKIDQGTVHGQISWLQK
jgi:dipeptidyl aminopeptidase/acylaminoacyl peptidase